MEIRLLAGTPTSDTSTTGWTDYTDYLPETQWTVHQKVGAPIDTLSITLRDFNANLDIQKGHDIVIEDFNDPTVRLFGGTIANKVSRPVGIERELSITAQDYTLLLERATIRKQYKARLTDWEVIVDAVVTAGRTEINTDRVRIGRNMDALDFQNSTLSSMMDAIIGITGYKWHVDAWKRLHYYPNSFYAGSFIFSDLPDFSASYPYYEPVMNETLATWNAVNIEGASGISEDIVDIYSNANDIKKFTVGQQPGTHELEREPTTADDTDPHLFIERNTGTNDSPVWTRQIVKTPGEAVAIADVVWTSIGSMLEWASAPPNIENSFRIKGRELTPAVVRAQDSEAIARHGRQYRYSMIVPEATTVNKAYDIGQGFLRDYDDKATISFKHNQDGMETGSLTRLRSANLGLQEVLIFIYSTDIRMIGGETAEYSVNSEILDPAIIFGPTP